MKKLKVSLLCVGDSGSPLEEFDTLLTFFLDQELPTLLLSSFLFSSISLVMSHC